MRDSLFSVARGRHLRSRCLGVLLVLVGCASGAADHRQAAPWVADASARAVPRVAAEPLWADAFAGLPNAPEPLAEVCERPGDDSSSLSRRSVSAINPRAILYRLGVSPANVEFVALAYARGEQFCELAVLDRKRNLQPPRAGKLEQSVVEMAFPVEPRVG